jgi:hypothetical protein
MKKQDIMQYITILIIIAFVGEMFVFAFGGNSSSQTATPIPTATAKVFIGNGTAQFAVTGLTGQLLAECNATSETILESVVNNITATPGVQYATSGPYVAGEMTDIEVILSTTQENQTSVATAGIASALGSNCEPFSLLRKAYVLPVGNLNLSGYYVGGSGTAANETVSNYSLLSYAQMNSNMGVDALVDYRTGLNSTSNAVFTVKLSNGIPSAASANQITPQDVFSGQGNIMGKVVQIAPLLLVKCLPDDNYTLDNITAAFAKLNLTLNSSTADLYVINYSQTDTNASTAAQEINSSINFCQSPLQVFQIGLVSPLNGSSCGQNATYSYTDRTEFLSNADSTCRNVTFNQLEGYAASSGAYGIETALDVSSFVNKTVLATVNAAVVNGAVVEAIAQEG